MQKIAVQRNLIPVQEYLSERGYEVDLVDFDGFTEDQSENYDAIVLTGDDDNFHEIESSVTDAPVIDATGMTPEEVCEQIEQAFL